MKYFFLVFCFFLGSADCTQEKNTKRLIPVSKIENLKQIVVALEKNIYCTDQDKIINYVNDFPYGEYEINTVPGYGLFFVDSISDLIKGDLRRGLNREPHIADLIRTYALDGTQVLDLGAHIGTHSVTMWLSGNNF